MTSTPERHDAVPAPAARRRDYLLMVAIGAFATTFAQQRSSFANYPIVFLLKERLHFGREQVAEFFMWATFAWSMKPLAGVLTDAFPIRGSRRRAYLVLGGLIGGSCWALLGAVTGNYHRFLLVSILLNVGLVLASTAMGGLQVEAGQLFGLSGRISSLRQAVMSIALIAGPVLGGWLANKAFGYTGGLGTLVMLALVIFALFGFKETATTLPSAEPLPAQGPRYRPSASTWIGVGILLAAGTGCVLVHGMLNVGLSLFAMLAVFLFVLALAMTRVRNPVLLQAQRQLSQILRSRALWLAAGMLFLVYVVPGFNTALTYRQSDELHFSKQLIGRVAGVEGAAGVVFALVYAVVCSRFNLRTLIVFSMAANAAGTLLFLIYTASDAYAVHAVTGALSVLSELALMDLAVRSTPPGCEGLGFALMMSVRNFGIAMSDVGGSMLMDQAHFNFTTLVLINACTTAAVLLFVPALPKALILRKEGERQRPGNA